ncbi:hypothetical protein BC941DRAFT_479128 [Chlamydoabsidia padenii]|nr:hypothetical protein BC941DRAFT_479128 [Chlamydoabsidia padenii]
MTDQSVSQDNDRPMDINLDSFYADVLSKKFNSSVEAIDYCRKQCAHFGFTIKQEQSTYRNIYVYCSREGFPDSLRNPKSNPKRRRPSKRCDCRWRVVLNENNGAWEFRKSLNPEASRHNHELMRPEDIDQGWPKEMLDLICELTRQRLPTPDIRARVQLLFADIPWNERRFYNRLSEERQKQRVRDAEMRVQQLHGLWSSIVAAAAGSQELTEIAQADISRMVDKLCGMAQTDVATLPAPLIQQDYDVDDSYDVSSSQDAMDTGGDSSSQDESSKPTPLRKQGNKSTNADTPKGYTAVTIPQQVLYVKLHAHRVLQDVQQLHRRRSRSLAFSDDFTDFGGDDSSTSSNNQQKKQKTPMLKEIAQQQQQHPNMLSTTMQAQQMEAAPHQYYYQHHHPPQQQQPFKSDQTLPPSSGFMYPSSSHRENAYYTSTLYPIMHNDPMYWSRLRMSKKTRRGITDREDLVARVHFSQTPFRLVIID